MNRYIVTIEGTGLDDVEEAELPELPHEGDLIETKYGTCVVTGTKDEPGRYPFVGTISCRFPS